MPTLASRVRSNSYQRQVALRKQALRRRRSLQGLPDLFITRSIPIGSRYLFGDEVTGTISYNRPFTMSTKFRISGAPSGNFGRFGEFFMGFNQGRANIEFTSKAPDGASFFEVNPRRTVFGPRVITYTMAFRPGDTRLSLWDQEGILIDIPGSNPSGPWSDRNSGFEFFDISGSNSIQRVAPINIYTLQLPRHFLGEVRQPPTPFDGSFVHSMTAWFMNPGFPTGLEET